MAEHRRNKPLRVIAVGLPRTGNQSLAAALRRLGFTPYESKDWEDGEPVPKWTTMLRPRVEGGPSAVTAARVDELTGDFDCIVDAPVRWLVDDLVRIYPDAKFILHERDFDSWHRSMQSTLLPMFKMIRSPVWRILDPYGGHKESDEYLRLDEQLLCCGKPDDVNALRRAFEEHHAHVKDTVPGTRLLVYRVQRGWAPLCEFLGLEVPNEPFPHVNDGNTFRDATRATFRMLAWRCVRNVTLVVAPVAVAALAYFYRS